jgi:hypothetical protein
VSIAGPPSIPNGKVEWTTSLSILVRNQSVKYLSFCLLGLKTWTQLHAAFVISLVSMGLQVPCPGTYMYDWRRCCLPSFVASCHTSTMLWTKHQSVFSKIHRLQPSTQWSVIQSFKLCGVEVSGQSSPKCHDIIITSLLSLGRQYR